MIDNTDEQIGQLGLRLATSVTILSAYILAISSEDPERVSDAREELLNVLRSAVADLKSMAGSEREALRARQEYIDACVASPETKARLRAIASPVEVRLLEEAIADARRLAGPELAEGQEESEQ